jgi:hypothetical protein
VAILAANLAGSNDYPLVLALNDFATSWHSWREAASETEPPPCQQERRGRHKQAFGGARAAKMAFANSYAEDALTGRFWYWGWIGGLAGLTLVVVTVPGRQGQRCQLSPGASIVRKPVFPHATPLTALAPHLVPILIGLSLVAALHAALTVLEQVLFVRGAFLAIAGAGCRPTSSLVSRSAAKPIILRTISASGAHPWSAGPAVL